MAKEEERLMNSKGIMERKKVFVAKISDAITESNSAGWNIEKIEYQCLRKQYSEFVRISYKDGARQLVNVTGNSERSILVEIARELNGQMAIGSTTDPRHAALIESWWNDAEKDPEA